MKNCICNNMVVMRKCDLLTLASWIWNEATSCAETQVVAEVVEDIHKVTPQETELVAVISNSLIWADDAEIPSTVCDFLEELGYEL